MMTFFSRCVIGAVATCATTLVVASEHLALPNSVLDALETYSLNPENLSVLVRDLDTGQDVLSIYATVPRNPASTMKLLTGLGALELLGPAYRWQTKVYSDAEPVNGVIDGDLYWRGSGDPYLVEERLYVMLQSLRRKGLHTVTGKLLMDDARFAPSDEDTGAFDQQPLRVYNALPSAVLTNFNSTRFEFRPSGDNSVSISAIPELPGLNILNALRLKAAECRGYRRGISVSGDGANRIRFDGQFPARCRVYRMTRSVLQAYRYSGELIQSLWNRLGGTIRGAVVKGVVPDDAVELLAFDSLPLAEVVRLMNKHSSNLVARHLILSIAAELDGVPASEAAGIQYLRDWLRTANIDLNGMEIENGAGRSRIARLSARQLVELIEYGFASRYMPEFLASLPILGEDGTLSDRNFSPNLKGHAHMKTGSIDHVAALAGVFQHPAGKRYAVAILQNDTNVHRGTGVVVQDRLLQWLGSQNPETLAR